MQDRYLHLEAVRHARTGTLGPETARLLADLVAFAHRQAGQADDQRFAADALATLVVHPSLSALGRICLAQAAPGAPMLWVAGSANRPGMGRNAAGPGYHCFFADGSSLAGLADGWMRSYPDARGVAASFARAGLPPQRTIRMVGEMGLRSGLCLPLRQDGARGFLFINSLRADETAWADPDLGLALAVLGQLARTRLRPVPAADVPPPSPARPLAAGAFAEAVRARFAARWGAPPAAVVAAPSAVLWSQGAALAVLDLAMAAFGADPAGVTVALRPAQGSEVPLALTGSGAGCPLLADRLPGLAMRLAPWRVAVDAAEDGLVLRLPCDPRWHRAEIGDDEVCYSI